MYVGDMAPIVLSAIFFFFFNPVMTTVFLIQRFKGLGNWVGPVFIGLAILLTFIQFLLGNYGASWSIVYAVTITILVILDRLAKRRQLKKHTSR